MNTAGDDLGVWEGRRVLLTGDTGFKGAWLALLLAELGAEVTGLALAPEHSDALYASCGVEKRIDHHTIDIRDTPGVTSLIRIARPEAVFHLAAQSLVTRGFRDPVATYDVNVVGTASLLAACRPAAPAVVLVVTSDKVYANDGAGRAFVESDRLGGGDPYSTSKAATELVVESWRHSFFRDIGPVLATARAGNVIGGGDMAEGRLLPDIYRALSSGVSVQVRNPRAVRPFQFVLEPLVGYLRYAAHLLAGDDLPGTMNFGPPPGDVRSVEDVVVAVLDQWGGGSWAPTQERPGPEASVLVLDSSLAQDSLGWTPQLDLITALAWTTEWYRLAVDGGDRLALTLDQISRYQKMLA